MFDFVYFLYLFRVVYLSFTFLFTFQILIFYVISFTILSNQLSYHFIYMSLFLVIEISTLLPLKT